MSPPIWKREKGSNGRRGRGNKTNQRSHNGDVHDIRHFTPSQNGDAVNTFDPSEFPSLGNSGSREASTPSSASLSTRSNYVGMVKQPVIEPSEFQMSNEDFPALPGQTISAPLAVSTNVGSSETNPPATPSQTGNYVDVTSTQTKSMVGQREISTTKGVAGIQLQKQGIQTGPDGLVTNIPPSMVTDQFGIIGLLTFIRAAETDPNLVSLALGADMMMLGLNLNSEVNLYPTFGGPWAETPCRPQDIDLHVPFEYLTNATVREKLAPVKLNMYNDDILFFMFYTNVGDVLQLAAAAELYNRDWRYHKEDKVWITRAPGLPPSEKTTSYERGTYYFFDVTNWRKVPKQFHLNYDKLEHQPSLPENFKGNDSVHSGSATGPSSSSDSPVSPGTGSPPQDLQHSPLKSGTRSVISSPLS